MSAEAAAMMREQRERDAMPCPHCGGDLLRPTFEPRPYCHAGGYIIAQEAR